MSKSRYSDTEIIDGKFYGSFHLPVKAQGLRELDLLEGVKTVDYVYKVGDRMDHLAARYYNEESYWWVICLVNKINYPFASGGLIPGMTLKIPIDVQDIFDQIFK